MTSPLPHRVTVQLSEEQFTWLKHLASTQNVSLAKALRKALATESYLHQARLEGAKILIESNNSIRELVN
jgi:hypothetical protein